MTKSKKQQTEDKRKVQLEKRLNFQEVMADKIEEQRCDLNAHIEKHYANSPSLIDACHKLRTELGDWSATASMHSLLFGGETNNNAIYDGMDLTLDVLLETIECRTEYAKSQPEKKRSMRNIAWCILHPEIEDATTNAF